jgi:hypothetical protein
MRQSVFDTMSTSFIKRHDTPFENYMNRRLFYLIVAFFAAILNVVTHLVLPPSWLNAVILFVAAMITGLVVKDKDRAFWCGIVYGGISGGSILVESPSLFNDPSAFFPFGVLYFYDFVSIALEVLCLSILIFVSCFFSSYLGGVIRRNYSSVWFTLYFIFLPSLVIWTILYQFVYKPPVFINFTPGHTSPIYPAVIDCKPSGASEYTTVQYGASFGMLDEKYSFSDLPQAISGSVNEITSHCYLDASVADGKSDSRNETSQVLFFLTFQADWIGLILGYISIIILWLALLVSAKEIMKLMKNRFSYFLIN